MIQVLNRAFDIVEFLAETPQQARRLSEIADQVGLNHGTCANILKTLMCRGMIEQIAPKKGYRLGPLISLLSRRVPYRQDLARIAEPRIVRLAHAVGETVLIATLHQGKRFIICQTDGNRFLQIKDDFLFRNDVYQCATGRLLLASLPSEEISLFILKYGLPKQAWPEVKTKEQLMSALARIRRQELAICVTASQVVGIAMPIREGKTVIAALGLFLPSLRFKGKHKKNILARMKATVEQLNTQLFSTRSLRLVPGGSQTEPP